MTSGKLRAFGALMAGTPTQPRRKLAMGIKHILITALIAVAAVAVVKRIAPLNAVVGL